MKPISRVEKLETAVACGVCALSARFALRYLALQRAWRLEDTRAPLYCEMRCAWCGGMLQVNIAGVPDDGLAAMILADDLYWRGEICKPEFKAARARFHDALQLASEEFYGEHLFEIDQLGDEYQAALAAFKPLPYLCRVPGCACDHAKTVEELEAFRDEVTTR